MRLGLALGALAFFAVLGVARAQDASGLERFDAAVEGFMRKRGVPGGALAVVKDRRLVHAKGYGLADRESGEAVRPESLFRIASISKAITGVAVLKLVEQGQHLAQREPARHVVAPRPALGWARLGRRLQQALGGSAARERGDRPAPPPGRRRRPRVAGRGSLPQVLQEIPLAVERLLD